MTDNIGIFDPKGLEPNPLTGEPYSQEYRDLADVWSTYPAYTKAKEILNSISNNQITFITAGTGTGKTVLVPKLALHHLGYQGKIAITLPKRILTFSAASFAAKTLDVELGTHIGLVYKGSDKKMIKPENKLVYMTDGSLIMKFVQDPLLTEYNVIIMDEAHERRVQIDLLLLFLKRILQSGKRPDLRVIIMSATIDASKYQNYFSAVKSNLIHVSGQPMYDIKVHFLDEPSDSYLTEGLKLIEKLIGTQDILFFITTSAEALQLCRTIRSKDPKVFCIEVYADMDKDLKIYAESRDKYLELGNYDQKFIMATNVAESSITIDGLKVVIDSGYELFSYYDPFVLGQVLEKRLISQAQALQRRGRVGRTDSGICYHLITKDQFNKLAPYPEPEILKQDITIDIIKIIQLTDTKTYSEAEQLLGQLMDPPKKSYTNVSKDLITLYKIIDTDDYITIMGSHITRFSSLPLNQSLFLLYSYQLYCAREVSIILAMMEALNRKLSNLFFKTGTLALSKIEKQSNKKLIKELTKKKGDHLTFLNIYQKFKEATDQKSWARKYGIRLDALNKADRLFKTYYYKLLNISKAPQLDRAKEINTNERIIQALKMSHIHLTARRMLPTYSQKKVEGQINKDSAVHYHYHRKELADKTFIYDELVSINNNWEYNMITLIKN